MTRQDNSLVGYMIIRDQEKNSIVKLIDIRDRQAFDLMKNQGVSLNNFFSVELEEYPKCDDCGDVLHRNQVVIKDKKYCMHCSFRYTASGKVRKKYQQLEAGLL